jgi:superfamily II DNA or RNA helicase
LAGSEAQEAALHLDVEPNVTPAHFPPPPLAPEADHSAANLLADALRMALRHGAGPFRCFGNIAVQPRSYQLVPLLMALKLDPVRLLIADDVGIGKTIEALLIARELWDRGEVTRLTVLCPPHLVEQWVQEVAERFHLPAVAVTAGTAARLERGLRVDESIFGEHAVTVVSLDYIKSDRHRHDFLRACPSFVIVDEAHTCTSALQGRHRRFELLRELANSPDRHLVLLTATPHSGDDAAFYQLLGLLDRDFVALQGAAGEPRERLRERLAQHFVQRRRPDIDEWHEDRLFPQRLTAEVTYTLTGRWLHFFDTTLDYCAAVVAAGGDERRQRLNFWGTLALMRCVASSPAAAVRALRSRWEGQLPEDEEAAFGERLFDGSDVELVEDDIEPAADTGDAALASLLAQAERLAGESGDPKLRVLAEHLDGLVREGFNPVVFCRYIATAHYLAEHLRCRFPKVAVASVTGELTADERITAIEALAEAGQRLLIATDCLSEGVNLQSSFDAVVHYDLSWNPTRHEQREGRVDRFGQPRETVKATLMYGANNPVDGAVLSVILRKAESIRKELGVPVPVPDEGHSLTRTLMQAVLLRRRHGPEQFELGADVFTLPEARVFEARWVDAMERASRNRTVFAQRRLKPEDVLPEWRRIQAVLGGHAAVERFVTRTLVRFGAAVEPLVRGAWAPLQHLPGFVQERLLAEGLRGRTRIDFAHPPAPGARYIHRSHPLVAVLADALLEQAMQGEASDGRVGALLGRVGVWRTRASDQRALVLLLRLRHQLRITRQNETRTLLVEEALPVALLGREGQEERLGDVALELLAAPAESTLPEAVRQRELDALPGRLQEIEARLAALADRQADALLADHQRVRDAAQARGRYAVTALTPVDVLAAYVLMPAGA